MEVLCDGTILIANSNCINEANKKYEKALDDALTTLCVCDPAWCQCPASTGCQSRIEYFNKGEKGYSYIIYYSNGAKDFIIVVPGP